MEYWIEYFGSLKKRNDDNNYMDEQRALAIMKKKKVKTLHTVLLVFV